METVTSIDGTEIAYERSGEGESLIVVAGAMCDRARARGISDRLAENFAVINYDRRGRGDSGDAEDYEVQREIEDIAALIEAAGGSALVYAHSSGAALGLQAAAAGLAVSRLIAHEAPYQPRGSDGSGAARRYEEDLKKMLGEGRRGDAIELFMGMTGMPAEMIGQMLRDPSWEAMQELAPSLAHDAEVMGNISHDSEIPAGLLERVEMPVLAMYGSISPPRMKEAAIEIAEGVPDGALLCLDGQHHVVAPQVLAPVVVDFFRPQPVA